MQKEIARLITGLALEFGCERLASELRDCKLKAGVWKREAKVWRSRLDFYKRGI